MSDIAGEWLPGLSHPEEIGRGGFGVVYRAWEPELERWVAVKLLTEVDESSARRFERERRAIGALSGHPHITSVYRWGSTDDGRPYLVMEFLSGGSFEDRLERGATLPWQDVADLGVKVASALETAHRAGVFHRDVKPGNLLLSEHSVPLLCDFGIARMSDGYQTKSGVLTASVHHAPPEVFDGAPFSAPSDVYSLGSTLEALVLGSPPFARDTDETIISVIVRVANEPPPDLTQHGVPQPVADVLDKAMAKTPADRYQSALEMARAMQVAQIAAGTDPTPVVVTGEPAFVEGAAPGQRERPGDSTVVVDQAPVAAALASESTPVPPDGGGPAAPPEAGPEPEPKKGGRGVWIALAAVVVLLLAAVGGYLLLSGGDSDDGNDDVATDTTAGDSTQETTDTTSDSTESTDTNEASIPDDQLDIARLETDMEADYLEQVGITIDLTCPSEVARGQGNNFDCTGPDADGDIITVSVTQTDAEGRVEYHVSDCQGDTCTAEE